MHLVGDDIERSWTITMSPEGFESHPDRRGEADATLRGPASSLYQAMWGRGQTEVQIDGDAAALDAWLDNVKPKWS